jgi:hypothetical protein
MPQIALTGSISYQGFPDIIKIREWPVPFSEGHNWRTMMEFYMLYARISGQKAVDI